MSIWFYVKIIKSFRGEMDITSVFGTVVLGSSPGRCTSCGIGLVVEYVLAKDETRVRFSYSAQNVSFIRPSIGQILGINVDNYGDMCIKDKVVAFR